MRKDRFNPHIHQGLLELGFEVVILFNPSLGHFVRGELVHVDIQRFSKDLEVLLPEGKYRRHAFVQIKLGLRNASGGIVNGSQETAFWSSVLKPVFVGAVELLHLTHGAAALSPGAMVGTCSCLLGCPK